MECCGKVVHHRTVSDEKEDIKKQKLDEENVETSLGKSREERLQMFMDTFENKEMFVDDYYEWEDGSHAMTFRDFASHQLDMIENDGFDVEDYRKVNDVGMVRWLYDPAKNIMTGERKLSEITDCSREAIEEYNMKMNKHFAVVRVIKANVEPLSPYMLYITFEAHDGTENITQTFQAQVAVRIPITKREVELVRIKQPPQPIVITRPRVAVC